jgi:hypothetical protein
LKTILQFLTGIGKNTVKRQVTICENRITTVEYEKVAVIENDEGFNVYKVPDDNFIIFKR